MSSSERNRERSPLDRKRRTNGGAGDKSGARRAPPERRVFVSNIPFDMKWQELKDLFREHVGEVTYVELFNDEHDRPRGCGVLDLASADLVTLACEKMHRFELKGRKLVVKEDFDFERDKYGKIIKGSANREEERNRNNVPSGSVNYGNTYGLSTHFLESLGIDMPLHTRVFVANLVYTVDEKKLREVFRLAGRVVCVELSRDKEGKSRGHAIIEYDHPVEAVQAISMFNNQSLYDRYMSVRLDKVPGPSAEELAQLPSRLPDGLSSVGMGLGSGGNPLTEVAKNVSQHSGNVMTGANLTSANAPANSSLDQGTAAAGLGLILRQLGVGGNAGVNSNNSNNLGGVMGGNANNTSGLTALLTGLASLQNIGGGMGANNGLGTPLNSGSSAPVGSGLASVSTSLSGATSMGGLGSSNLSNLSMSLSSSTGLNDIVGRGSNAFAGQSTGGFAGNLPPSARPGLLSEPPSMSNRIGPANNSGSRGSSDTVIVRNLPLDCTWQDLRELFSVCGDIKFAEMKDRHIGIVRFGCERDAERAVAMMDNSTKGGHVISVRLY